MYDLKLMISSQEVRFFYEEGRYKDFRCDSKGYKIGIVELTNKLKKIEIKKDNDYNLELIGDFLNNKDEHSDYQIAELMTTKFKELWFKGQSVGSLMTPQDKKKFFKKLRFICDVIVNYEIYRCCIEGRRTQGGQVCGVFGKREPVIERSSFDEMVVSLSGVTDELMDEFNKKLKSQGSSSMVGNQENEGENDSGKGESPVSSIYSKHNDDIHNSGESPPAL